MNDHNKETALKYAKGIRDEMNNIRPAIFGGEHEQESIRDIYFYLKYIEEYIHRSDTVREIIKDMEEYGNE